MIIKSAKACGFLDIGPEKQQEFPLESGNVNIVNNSTIIKVLSIIFDSTYDSTHDFSEFFNQDYLGKHFVEVVLIQNDDSLVKNFSWLKDKHLTLVRNLETPKLIHINGKSLKVDIFHEAISSLGFISIDGFHMHRLLKEEITRLGLFTGDDLWNLILKVNSCEGLVRSIELKNKKEKVMREQMEKQIEVVEDVLPLKLQLRDEIRSQLTLTRRFNTLNSIASERKLKILQNEKQVNDNELQKLKEAFNEKSLEFVNFKYQRVVGSKRSCSDRTLKYAIEKERNWLLDEIEVNKVPVSKLGPTFLELHKRTVTIESAAVTFLEELEQNIEESYQFQRDKLFKSQVDVEIFDWLLCFKLSVSNEAMQIKQSQFRVISTEVGKFKEEFKLKLAHVASRIHELKADLTTTQHLNPQEMFDTMRVHYQQESEMKRTMMNLKAESVEHQHQILEIDKQMFAAATLGGFDLTLIETMRAIEMFISKDPQLLVDYLGPVFSHLVPQPEVEYKIWPRLAPLANVFLFVKGTTARKAVREMIASGIGTVTYTFLGIDEFVPSPRETLPDEVEYNVRSAENLVNDSSHASVQNVIKLMLRDLRFMEENFNETAVRNVSTYNTCSLVTKTKESIEIKSLLPNIFEAQGTTPVKVLHEIYDGIKKYVVVKTKLLAVRDLIEKLQHQLEYHQMILALEKIHTERFEFSSFSTFLKLASLLTDKAEYLKQNAKYEVLFEALQELSEDLDQKIASCVVDEVREMKAAKEKDLLEETKLSKSLDFAVESKMNELKSSVERMTNHSKLMRKLLSNVLNPFEMFIDNETEKLKGDFVEVCEAELEKYKAMLREINGTIQPSQLMTNEAELNVDLIDLRCRLYEKNSEKDVIDSAMRKCHESIVSEESESLFDFRLYNKFVKTNAETLAAELVECQERLRQHKSESNIGSVTTEQYGHLVDSIKKVEKYATSPTPTVKRNTLASHAFPMVNRILVKVLKDAVHNYRSSFKVVMKEFIKKSSLYFYTRGVFDEIGFDSFSWESFDMARLKAMDFVVIWSEAGKKLIDPEALRKVKGFLLILHIINYISIFKFIVIDETLFEDMDETLAANLRKLLETVSPFIQIILLKAKNEVEEGAGEVEPMDISE